MGLASLPRVLGGCRPLSPCAFYTEVAPSLCPPRGWCTPCRVVAVYPLRTLRVAHFFSQALGRCPWRPVPGGGPSFPGRPPPPGLGRVTPGDSCFSGWRPFFHPDSSRLTLPDCSYRPPHPLARVPPCTLFCLFFLIASSFKQYLVLCRTFGVIFAICW